MSAAEAIHNRIHGEGYCDPPCGLCREVVDLLEGYAHELAERLRITEPDWDGDEEAYMAWNAAADLIDPEVG